METGYKNTGLYVHVPFCLQKCPYCDFSSFDDNIYYADDYINALSAELEYYKKNYNPVYETLFIGGGTPPRPSEKQLDYLFASVYRCAERKNLKEITIEANPETLTGKKARVLKINADRVSMGAQSFNNKFLKELGRVHDSAAVLKAADILKQNGIDNFNIDLMFGIPGQAVTDVIYDIKAAVKLNPSHISFYMLTLYENTPYAESAKPPQDSILAQMYEKGVEALEAEGYRQYEISNFAKPGKKCLHNLNYWGMGHYIGIGTSASSYFDGKRYTNIKDVAEYIKRMKQNERKTIYCSLQKSQRWKNCR